MRRRYLVALIFRSTVLGCLVSAFILLIGVAAI
jgi:hypothetical protein